MSKKVLVVLSGSGVYDGTKSRSRDFSPGLCALWRRVYLRSPKQKQMHVINHATGDVMDEEKRLG